jgi:capsular exopolysaccharide synthesis family protein
LKERRSYQKAKQRLRAGTEFAVVDERKSMLSASGVMDRLKNAKSSLSENGYGFSPRLAFLTEPMSYTSEQYRKLRTIIFNLREKSNYKTFVITSAGLQDGKTITSINLALAMANDIDKKIILIDCDLRKPRIHEYLGLEMQPGLVDLIRDSSPSINLSVIKQFKNLSVLTCGDIPENPTELLNSVKMRQILEVIKANYDVVLIDSVPMIPIADTMILSEMSDGAIMVVRADKTDYSAVEKAIPLLGDKIVGVVLNALPLNKVKDTMYYSYYYRTNYRDHKVEKLPKDGDR